MSEVVKMNKDNHSVVKGEVYAHLTNNCGGKWTIMENGQLPSKVLPPVQQGGANTAAEAVHGRRHVSVARPTERAYFSSSISNALIEGLLFLRTSWRSNQPSSMRISNE